MIRPHERPPRIWPIVIATIAGLAILVTLGAWQVKRLAWKEALLAQLAANAAAPPSIFPPPTTWPAPAATPSSCG